MAYDAEATIERRRLRRKLTSWRLAFLLLLAVLIVAVSTYSMSGVNIASPHIAKIRIEGTIFENEELLKRLDQVAENDAVKGVILIVDSPGGTTVGGESIFEAVRKIADKKPVVAQVGTLAASAGYMIASASDHIVARQTSIIGSIGVLFQYPDISVLLDKLGIQVEAIKSSPLKAEPNYFSPASEEAKAMIRSMIMDSYDWFVDLVEERRSFTHEEALAVANGAVFTGRQALEKKLIDALGGEDEAVEWLEDEGVSEDLPRLEWKPQDEETGFTFRDLVVQAALRSLGLPQSTDSLITDKITDRIFLDGILSVWQVDGKSATIPAND